MKNKQYNQSYNDFSENHLAPLFYQYIDILKSHHFHKEAKDLLKVAKQHYLPENSKIIIELQKGAVSDEMNKFEQLLRQLQK